MSEAQFRLLIRLFGDFQHNMQGLTLEFCQEGLMEDEKALRRVKHLLQRLSINTDQIGGAINAGQQALGISLADIYGPKQKPLK